MIKSLSDKDVSPDFMLNFMKITTQKPFLNNDNNNIKNIFQQTDSLKKIISEYKKNKIIDKNKILDIKFIYKNILYTINISNIKTDNDKIILMNFLELLLTDFGSSGSFDLSLL